MSQCKWGLRKVEDDEAEHKAGVLQYER
jgi:hypothetical protein